MNFVWPHLLWLVLVPLALLAWEVKRRGRRAARPHPKILQIEAGARSLEFVPRPSALSPLTGRPRLWLCLGLALAIVALARPQWGRIEEPVFDQSREILLAIDLSRSMLTPDVKPSRLDRAKLLIQSLLEKLQGERVGLVVFSGTAFLQSPLSADYEILREFLPSLNPGFLPEGGTNYGALLGTALDAFSGGTAADRFLIVLSDGEATDEDWRGRVAALKEKGIRVLSLGLGSAGGGMIPDGAGGFVKDERGAVVLSKLESATLQELAEKTGGVYRDASGWVDLAALVKQTVEAGKKGKFVEKNTVRYVERFQWPLALALWCLLVSFYYEFPVRPKPRELLKPGSRKTADGSAAASVAVLLLGALLAWPPAGFAAATIGRLPPSPSAQAGGPADSEPPPRDPAEDLAKIVGRLAGNARPSAHDWADLGRETVTWGSRLQSAHQPVSEGPVRDALAAVDLGAKLDPKATDWPKMREELEALLQKPEDQKQQQQKNQQQQQQDKDQQQKNDSSERKDQPSADQQKQEQQDKTDQKDSEKQNSPQSQKDRQQQNEKQDEKQKQPGESAFGDMKEKQEPPRPPNDTQKVGGAQEKKEPSPEQSDPALALPMQKLEQIRSQDSPAQLFQLMEGDRKAQKKSGKDW
jgi:Ca-activated chloride channel family protein